VCVCMLDVCILCMYVSNVRMYIRMYVYTYVCIYIIYIYIYAAIRCNRRRSQSAKGDPDIKATERSSFSLAAFRAVLPCGRIGVRTRSGAAQEGS